MVTVERDGVRTGDTMFYTVMDPEKSTVFAMPF